MAKISDVVKLKSGYANFVELKSAFEAAQENATIKGDRAKLNANQSRDCSKNRAVFWL